MNAAVVCGAVPPTGLPLPFVSAGGSSLVSYLAATGALLSVSRRSAGRFLRPEAIARETKSGKRSLTAGRAAA